MFIFQGKNSTYPEWVTGGDGDLSLVPPVSSFSGQRPQEALHVLSACHLLDEDAQGTDAIAKHVSPKLQTERLVLVGGLKVGTSETCLVPWSSREPGVDEHVASLKTTVGEGGAVGRGARCWALASSAELPVKVILACLLVDPAAKTTLECAVAPAVGTRFHSHIVDSDMPAELPSTVSGIPSNALKYQLQKKKKRLFALDLNHDKRGKARQNQVGGGRCGPTHNALSTRKVPPSSRPGIGLITTSNGWSNRRRFVEARSMK